MAKKPFSVRHIASGKKKTENSKAKWWQAIFLLPLGMLLSFGKILKLARLHSHKSFPNRRNLLGGFLRFFLWGSFALLVFISLFVGNVLRNLPEIDEIRNFTFAQSTQIFDRTGEVKLYEIHGDEHRQNVALQDVSQNFIDAILAAEDDAFFSHPGFDIGGIAKAACHELSKKVGMTSFGGLCPPRGGSTLTQQLVKNSLLSNERTVSRKVKEWFLARKIEKYFSKKEILELYLNQVSFGAISGVQTASRTFFGKNAAELSVAESAILAAVVRKPTFYSPWGNHAFVQIKVSEDQIEKLKLRTREHVLALPGITVVDGLRGKYFKLYGNANTFFPGRANWVLERMKAVGFLQEMEFVKANIELENLEIKEFRQSIKAPHFVMFVREILEEKFSKEIVEKGGLKVLTTLDFALQQSAEEIVQEQAERNETNFQAKNAALVALENQTGHILAMVGSRDFWEKENDGNVNVILQKRLPGSSFKPIVYAAGFLSGKLSPATVLFDVETDFGQDWIPQNYDGKFSGPVSLRKALGHSLNVPAVKVSVITGAQKIVDLANKIGAQLDRSADFFGNAIALGGGEVRPIDMAQAFSVFANGGKKPEITGILQVRNRAGNILLDNSESEPGEQQLDEQVAFLVTDVLADPAARGEGWNSRLQLSKGRPNAVKTGTSNKKIEDEAFPFDTWTIGFTPQITTAVWAGNNDGTVLNHEASGFATAAPIWKSFMENAHSDLPIEQFSQPEKIKIVPVSKISGKLPLQSMGLGLIVNEKFADFAVPREIEDSVRIIRVDRVSGKRPNQFTPLEALEKRAILNLHSFFPNNENWEKPVQQWAARNGKKFVTEFGAANLAAFVPTEIDDVHTAQTAKQKPVVQIISPSNATATPPILDVRTQVVAANGLEKMQFFFDDEFLTELQAPQTNTILHIREDLQSGSTHTLKIVTIDRLWFSTLSEIDLKIKSDTTPPQINIVLPSPGQHIGADCSVEFFVEAWDESGAVSQVDFLVDGKKIGLAKERPFKVTFLSPATPVNSELTVVAFDTAGNAAREKVEFAVVSKASFSKDFEILVPKKDETVLEFGDFQEIEIGISREMVQNFESLEVFTQNAKGEKNSVAIFQKSDLPDSGIFQTVLPVKQELEIFAKVNFSGKSFFTQRKLLKVATEKSAETKE